MLFKTISDIETKNKTYQISRCGSVVRSVDIKTGNIRKLSVFINNGYKKVKIGNKPKNVHQLVAMTFVPKPEDYDETFTVDHKISEDKLNNHVDNLRWASKSDQRNNQRVKSRTLIHSMPVVAMKDGEVVHSFESMHDAENKIGANNSHISKCINGKSKYHMGFTWVSPPSDPDIPGEIWKEIGSMPNFKTLLSNFGRVGYAFECGYVKKISSFEKITEISSKELDTYPMITVKGKRWLLHALVWTTFVGPIPNGMIINHIDHDKQHTALSNLEIITRSENISKAHDAGRYDGTKRQRVRVIIGNVEYESLGDASRKTGIPFATIRRRVDNGVYFRYQ